MSLDVSKKIAFQRITLLSGVLSSLLYISTDLLASSRYKGYHMLDQNYSELLATGAPTRPVMLLESIAYNFLVAMLALGVWSAANPKRLARLTAAAIWGYAIFSMITPTFFQMDMRGTPMTSMGSLHGPMTAVMSLFIMLSMAFGAFLLGKRFRLYTLITILLLIGFGVLTSLQVPRLESGQSTPWMGLTERINIYATMVWFAAFSIALLKKERLFDSVRRHE